MRSGGQDIVRDGIERAVKGYAEEVRARTFPGPDNVYGMRKK